MTEHETEVREALENYNNLERECAAAAHAVSPELRARLVRLRDDWAYIRASTMESEERMHRSSSSESRRSSVESQSSGGELACTGAWHWGLLVVGIT